MRFNLLATQTTLALHALQVIAAFSLLNAWIGLPVLASLLAAPLIAMFPLTGPILGLTGGMLLWTWFKAIGLA